MMARRVNFLVVFLLSITICFLFYLNDDVAIPSEPYYSDFNFKSFHSSDAKFAYDGYVITSHQNMLCLIDSNTLVVNQQDTSSEWIGSIAHKNAVVYTNLKSVTRCGRIDPDNSVVTGNYTILESDKRTIDPALTFYDGKYYLCLTRINGNVNNNSPKKDNGLYSIVLFRSSDFENWEFVCNIHSAFKNLEDVKFSSSDKLDIIFEEEDYDKGSSRIYRVSSTESDDVWSEPEVIVENESDNEPTAIFNTDKRNYVFYSSDMEEKGKSYNGASAYLNTYDSDMKLISTKKIPLQFETGILLYDVTVVGDKIYFLYAHNYLTENDLCLEGMDLKEIGLSDLK